MTPHQQKALDRFLRDTANHEMHVLSNTDLYKHISFRRPHTSAYWFEIVTWPGSLCIRGDMGTYVFSREFDMLGFFRKGLKADDYHIDFRYWTQKIQSGRASGEHAGDVMELDRKAFNRSAMEQLNAYIEEAGYTREFVTELRCNLRDLVLEEVHDSTPPNEAHRLLHEFHYLSPRGDVTHFPYHDTESVPTNYTFHHLWCLFAVAYAVRKYDEYELQSSKSIAAHT